MTGGDQQKSLWADSLTHRPQPQDDVPRRAPDEARVPAPRSNAQRQSLWAGSREDQPERLDDVVVRWELEEPEPPASRTSPPPIPRRPIVLGVLAAVVVVLATAFPSGGFLSVENLPSYWDDVTMNCSAVRFEEGERALELFRCRAVGGGTLPPGVHRSPDIHWISDITRHASRASEITISLDGQLTGWAVY